MPGRFCRGAADRCAGVWGAHAHCGDGESVAVLRWRCLTFHVALAPAAMTLGAILSSGWVIRRWYHGPGGLMDRPAWEEEVVVDGWWR